MNLNHRPGRGAGQVWSGAVPGPLGRPGDSGRAGQPSPQTAGRPVQAGPAPRSESRSGTVTVTTRSGTIIMMMTVTVTVTAADRRRRDPGTGKAGTRISAGRRARAHLSVSNHPAPGQGQEPGCQRRSRVRHLCTSIFKSQLDKAKHWQLCQGLAFATYSTTSTSRQVPASANTSLIIPNYS